MFPRLEQRLRARLDLLVEFSTLGEYRVAAAGGLVPASSCETPHAGESTRGRGARCAPAPIGSRSRAGAPPAPYGVCREER